MASLPSLPVGTAWFWSPGWLDLFKRVEVRRRETFDSSATPKAGAKAAEPRRLADVDLEKLKGQIAATIERARAEDPKELRRQLAAARVEIARLAAAKPAPAAKERVEVSVLKDIQIKRLESLADRVEAGTLSRHGGPGLPRILLEVPWPDSQRSRPGPFSPESRCRTTLSIRL
jgi:hypothetical protein